MRKLRILNLSKTDALAIIISSPSGAGKTTVTKKLLSLFRNSYLSVSCTTRKKRPGEIHGVDYFFLNNKDFEKFKKNNKFIEYAKVHNNYYGTLKDQISKNLKRKKIVFFDVDWQGARVLREKLGSLCFSIFLLPPSISILKKRLLKRHRNESKLALDRFKSAKKDIIHFHEYDYLIVNNNLKNCVNILCKKINEVLRDRKLNLLAKLKAKKMLNLN